MSKTKIPVDDIIAAYNAAYEAANQKPPPKIVYERGWFLFYGYYGYAAAERIDARKRASEMVAMSERLTARAAEQNSMGSE